MPLTFITPTSWLADTKPTIQQMNVISQDLLYLNGLVGVGNINFVNASVTGLITLTGVQGILPTVPPATGILFQPASFLASGAMYLFGMQLATDLYPRFAYDANPNDSFGSSLVFGSGAIAPDVIIGRTVNGVGQLTISFNSSNSFEMVKIGDNLGRSIRIAPTTFAGNLVSFTLTGDAAITSDASLDVGIEGTGYGFRLSNTGNMSFNVNSLNVVSTSTITLSAPGITFGSTIYTPNWYINYNGNASFHYNPFIVGGTGFDPLYIGVIGGNNAISFNVGNGANDYLDINNLLYVNNNYIQIGNSASLAYVSFDSPNIRGTNGPAPGQWSIINGAATFSNTPRLVDSHTTVPYNTETSFTLNISDQSGKTLKIFINTQLVTQTPPHLINSFNFRLNNDNSNLCSCVVLSAVVGSSPIPTAINTTSWAFAGIANVWTSPSSKGTAVELTFTNYSTSSTKAYVGVCSAYQDDGDMAVATFGGKGGSTGPGGITSITFIAPDGYSFTQNTQASAYIYP